MTVLSAQQVEQFSSNGYVIFDPGFQRSDLDTVVADTSIYWEGTEPVGASYWDKGRIQDAWKINEATRKVATFPPILEALHQLYAATPLPFQTLNFRYGTEQRPHSDSIHFNSEPFGMMCGVWVALENVGPDQGPLIYYPGSQRLPEMNFDDFGIHPDYANYSQYEDELQSLIEREKLKPEYGLMKKGQALIWSANILHGGSERKNRDLTRHSQVTHYYFSGCKYWRPTLSADARHYFEPDWIPMQPASKWNAKRLRLVESLKKPLRRLKKKVLG